MAHILLDESGDLGFSFEKGSSKHFIVTFLFTEEKKKIDKIARKIFRQLKKKNKKRSSLHANKEKAATKRRLLTYLQQTDCKILVIVLNKKHVFTSLQDEKAVLYNYITNILLDRLLTKKPFQMPNEVTLLASRRETNTYLNQNFSSYLTAQTGGKHKLKLSISIAPHHEDRGLQVADFVSWAIYRKYEYSDDTYYNIIKKLIVEEAPLFP